MTLIRCIFHYETLPFFRKVLNCANSAILFQFLVILIVIILCNSILAGPSQSTIATLQGIQITAERLIMSLRLHDNIIPALCQLHWLPVEFRVTYKLYLLTLWLQIFLTTLKLAHREFLHTFT